MACLLSGATGTKSLVTDTITQMWPIADLYDLCLEYVEGLEGKISNSTVYMMQPVWTGFPHIY